jgi:hypothetical protein
LGIKKRKIRIYAFARIAAIAVSVCHFPAALIEYAEDAPRLIALTTHNAGVWIQCEGARHRLRCRYARKNARNGIADVVVRAGWMIDAIATTA